MWIRSDLVAVVCVCVCVCGGARGRGCCWYRWGCFFFVTYCYLCDLVVVVVVAVGSGGGDGGSNNGYVGVSGSSYCGLDGGGGNSGDVGFDGGSGDVGFDGGGGDVGFDGGGGNSGDVGCDGGGGNSGDVGCDGGCGGGGGRGNGTFASLVSLVRYLSEIKQTTGDRFKPRVVPVFVHGAQIKVISRESSLFKLRRYILYKWNITKSLSVNLPMCVSIICKRSV